MTILLENLKPANCAGIAIDCLNTFMKADGQLSISAYQKAVKGLNQEEVQTQIDAMARRTGELRHCLFAANVPQIQFQDAHVIESVHGKRFHSMEIVRTGEQPDFVRTFPPHALLDKNRRFGTADQQCVDETVIRNSKKVYIRWFEPQLPADAILEPQRELIFFKDDFCMSPGTPFIHSLFWELRRQGRFYLIVFGVCDEICNLRNVMLMLAAVFNVIYVKDCTFPLSPQQREVAIDYLQNFNPLGQGATGQFLVVTAHELLQKFGGKS